MTAGLRLLIGFCTDSRLTGCYAAESFVVLSDVTNCYSVSKTEKVGKEFHEEDFLE